MVGIYVAYIGVKNAKSVRFCKILFQFMKSVILIVLKFKFCICIKAFSLIIFIIT